MVQSDHPNLSNALAVAFALALSSCAFPVLPDDSDFALYHNTYRNRAAGQYTELDRKLAAGTLSRDQYNLERGQLDAEVTATAHEALLRHNKLVNQL